MSEEVPQPIHGGNISEIVRNAERITEGHDSIVYKVGNRIIKRYLNLDPNQLLDYKQATQKAATEFNKTTLDLDIKGKQPKVVINPIDQIVESETDFDVFSVSPFIEGETLNETEYEKESQSELENLSLKIIKETQFRGINIIPLNVKLQKTESGVNFVVTDICARVENLAKI